jgi:4-carboxymuconolactone decarboxylase
VWVRPDLAPRDRSLVAVDALIASDRPARPAGHLDRAVDHGPTREQASEAVAHLAFHAGWPNAFSAVPAVKGVFDNRSNQPRRADGSRSSPRGQDAYRRGTEMRRLTALTMLASLLASATAYAQVAAVPGPGPASAASGDGPGTVTVMRAGSQPPSWGPAEYFTGSVRVDPLFPASAPSRMSGGSVTFEPGARSAWHTHPLGQVLIVTAGLGWVQRWGGPVEEIRPGDVVWIPPGVKHWHGATATTGMVHIALQEHADGRAVVWMEKVSDEQYRR